MVYRSSMSVSRLKQGVVAVALLATGNVLFNCAATAQGTATATPAATNLPAQPLKLVPMPREAGAGGLSPRANAAGPMPGLSSHRPPGWTSAMHAFLEGALDRFVRRCLALALVTEPNTGRFANAEGE